MDNAEIDPYGVRDGDPLALESLVQRRGPSVIAYCNHVCGPAVGPAAAAETFARVRAVLREDENLGAIDTDQLLRRATRHTAAAIARNPQGPPPTGEIVGRQTLSCLDVAVMLAAAADGRVAADQRARLRNHIDACDRCSALAEITRRADAAYSDPASDRIGTDLTRRLTAAMAEVPADGVGSAPPPTGEVCSVPVFPELPDLDDEVPIGSVAAPDRPAADPGEPGGEPAGLEPARQRRWLRALPARRRSAQADERIAA